MQKTPLFALSKEILLASSVNETIATCVALAEMDACRFPFPRITIEFNLAEAYAAYSTDREAMLEAVDLSSGAWPVIQYRTLSESITLAAVGNGVSYNAYKIASGRCLDGTRCEVDIETATITYEGKEPYALSDRDLFRRIIAYTALVLVSALATPAVIKESSINKRADRDIGNGLFRSFDSKTIYLSRTRLSVPTVYDAETGRTVRPHIRRGHVHNFWTGRRDGVGERTLLKKFVAPTLVNQPEKFDPKDYTFKKESRR